ncbi:alpha/beta hydrolase-fold protein [Aquimarina sediminis]|uniref:alpha/beta hydrolase-fold protein n=1 Tax=Aquimarina sediminis TaxID=2070536 RepID=UPI000CA01199|nr:alpha/beta hydrolase-fold protein [Aquimarina sediminis]
MKITKLLTLICIIVLNTVFAQEKAEKDPDKPVVTLGEISSLHSKVLNKTIPLSIHLPENYDSSKKSYPVLYMLGSDYRARFAMLASTLDYMGEGQIPEMILIGIDLPEGNSILLPTRKNQDTKIPDNYINFFETELIPHVDNNYRTAPFKVLFGGSNSGFFCVYTLLNNPLLFNGYFASSPSLMIIPTELQQKIKSGRLKTLSENRFLHIIYSDDEGLTNHVSEFTRVLADHKPESFTYKVDELVNQGHVPAMDFTMFLLALYPDFNPYEKLDSLDKVIQHFEMLSKRYGYEIQPPVSVIMDLGFDNIISKNLVVAEEIFQRSLQLYPEAKEFYVGMGVVRRNQGQLENAKVMFEKALAIDPDFSLAKRWLKRVEK